MDLECLKRQLTANKDDDKENAGASVAAPVPPSKRKKSETEVVLQLFQTIYKDHVSNKAMVDECQHWLQKQGLGDIQLEVALVVVSDNLQYFYHLEESMRRLFLKGKGIIFPETIQEFDLSIPFDAEQLNGGDWAPPAVDQFQMPQENS